MVRHRPRPGTQRHVDVTGVAADRLARAVSDMVTLADTLDVWADSPGGSGTGSAEVDSLAWDDDCRAEPSLVWP